MQNEKAVITVTKNKEMYIPCDDLIGIMWWDNDIQKWAIFDDDFKSLVRNKGIEIAKEEQKCGDE